MRSGNRFQALDISSLKWYATVCWISIDAGAARQRRGRLADTPLNALNFPIMAPFAIAPETVLPSG